MKKNNNLEEDKSENSMVLQARQATSACVRVSACVEGNVLCACVKGNVLCACEERY